MRYLFLFLLQCSSSPPNVFDLPDGDIKDSSVEADATVPSKDGGYVACVEMTTKSTSYARLLEQDCVDSDGKLFLKDFWDLGLGIGCRWKPSASGIRCLPENEISSPLYADDICSQSIAPIEVSNQKPIEPYIGLDYYDGGSVDYIGMFKAGDLYDGGMYHNEEWGGSWNCVPIYLHFPETRMFYVGDGVDPSIFVLQ